MPGHGSSDELRQLVDRARESLPGCRARAPPMGGPPGLRPFGAAAAGSTRRSRPRAGGSAPSYPRKSVTHVPGHDCYPCARLHRGQVSVGAVLPGETTRGKGRNGAHACASHHGPRTSQDRRTGPGLHGVRWALSIERGARRECARGASTSERSSSAASEGRARAPGRSRSERRDVLAYALDALALHGADLDRERLEVGVVLRLEVEVHAPAAAV